MEAPKTSPSTHGSSTPTSEPATPPILDVSGLTSGYGPVEVLDRVTLDVAAGEVTAILGPNGAGKTTLLRCLAGLLPATGGQVRFQGEDCTVWSASERVRRGLSLCSEGRDLFPGLSVRENLWLGAYSKSYSRDELEARIHSSTELFEVLRERHQQPAGTLSGGEQQMLAIARCLMSEPTLLMLDEPSLGLAPKVLTQVIDSLRTLAARGVTVLLVEQNATAALGVADRAFVLERGGIVLEGTGRQLLDSEEVKERYLGF